MRRHIARSRFDAISDGVFAIAMTIMVLEIKTPDLGSSSHEAIERYLSGTLPTLGTYAVSFMMLAAMWVSHGRLPATKQHVSRKAAMANLHFLFFVCLIPFATSLLNRAGFEVISVQVFEGTLIVAMLLLARLRYHVMLHERTPSDHVRDHRKKVVAWAATAFAGMVISLIGMVWEPAIYVGYAMVLISVGFFRERRRKTLDEEEAGPEEA